MERLTNADRGTFAVDTEHSTYRISLTDWGKFLVRHPVHDDATRGLRDDEPNTQVALLSIEHMQVGEPALMQIRFPVYSLEETTAEQFVSTSRVTSVVLKIEKLGGVLWQ